MTKHMWGVDPIGDGFYSATVVEYTDDTVKVVFESVRSNPDAAEADLREWLATHVLT